MGRYRTLSEALDAVESATYSAASAADDARDAFDGLKTLFEEQRGDNFFAKAAHLLKQIADRRKGQRLATKEEEDIVALLDIYREWKVNNV